MSNLLTFAAIELLKREKSYIVAATGLLFERLQNMVEPLPVKATLESYRGGIWGNETMEGVGYPVLRSTNMRNTIVSVTTPFWCDIQPSAAESCSLQDGDILITKSSGSSDLVGKSCLFIDPKDGNTYLFSNFVLRLRTNRTLVLPKFMAWFLRSPQSLMWRVKYQQNAVGLRNLDTKMFLDQMISLPSLQIQQEIIDYLDRLEDGVINKVILSSPINEVHAAIARIEELAAKIEEARGLRREVVEEANRLLSSTISQNLTEIKHQSREVTLASVATSITDGDHQPPPKADSGIPFIFINHVSTGELDFTDCRWVPEDYYASISASRVPKRGDVLYTAVGSYGIACLVDTDEAFCFQRHIAIIKPDREQINPEYLKWALSSNNVYNQATHFATGSAQLTVPLRGIRQLAFPLPSLEKQSQLVTHFNELQTRLNSLKQQQTQTSAELNALLPSILDKAFKGEL